jgi:LPS sulfotransferase NodH
MLVGLSGICSARYDMRGRGPLRSAYIIAASFRSGSTHLCTRLWETGVLGAPFEYFNYEHEMKYLYARLGARSAADYLDKLVACRMSDNGVFGFKAHYPHFQAALRGYPELLVRLQPLRFVFIRREDKIAQAVSLAKAYQTRAWLSLDSPPTEVPLFYHRDFIAACLAQIRHQESAWTDWFAQQNVRPHPVLYEELMREPQRVLDEICGLLEADGDTPSRGEVPVTERQVDTVSENWRCRFTAESRAGSSG